MGVLTGVEIDRNMGHESFRQIRISRWITTLHPVFWHIMIYWFWYPLPLLLHDKGGRDLQERSGSIIIIPYGESISTYLFYKLYLLYSMGYALYYPDPLGKWADSWWPPFLFSEFGQPGTHGTKSHH
jgi:hypothetical protein